MASKLSNMVGMFFPKTVLTYHAGKIDDLKETCSGTVLEVSYEGKMIGSIIIPRNGVIKGHLNYDGDKKQEISDYFESVRKDNKDMTTSDVYGRKGTHPSILKHYRTPNLDSQLEKIVHMRDILLQAHNKIYSKK